MESFEQFREKLWEWMRLDYIEPLDIPSIELYMDQVTTFIEQQLAGSKRHPEDKTLTKTMINNYTKNALLPPPNKKRYSKNHIYFLIYIYYLKNFLSISDIQTLLAPMIESFAENPSQMEEIYYDIFGADQKQFKRIMNDIIDTHKAATKLFTDTKSSKERSYLQQFAFIAMLSYDIYLRKQLVESLIDQMPKAPSSEKKPEKKTEKKSK